MELRQRLLAEHAILERITKGAPLREVLEALVVLIEAQSAGIVCTVLLLDPDGVHLRAGAAPSLDPSYLAALDGATIGPSEGSCGAAAYTGEPVVVEDIFTHPNWASYRELAAAHGLRACWSTPVFSSERTVLGTFANYYRTPRLPTDEEREWVTVATHLASIAITRARTTEALERAEAQAKHVAQIHAVSSSLSEVLMRFADRRELYDAACRIAVEKGRAQLAWIGEYDAATDELRVTSRHGEPTDYADGLVLKPKKPGFEHSPATRALTTDRPSIANDLANDPTFRWSPKLLALGFRSCAVFPFHIDRGRRGLFTIYGRETGFFGDEEVAVLGALVKNIGFALDAARTSQDRERLLAELELASSVAKVGGWTVDLVARRLIWSEQLFALHEMELGPSPKLRDALASCAPEFRAVATAAFDACMREGTPFDLVLQMITAKNRRIWIRAIGTAERDNKGAIIKVHGALQDIDERRRLEDQLRQAQKMEAVGRLAGGVAHDFNNLLSVILSYSAFMIESRPAGDPVRADLEQILGAGKRASDLTRQLLTFSRQQATSPKRLELPRVLAGIEKMLRRLIGSEVTLSLPSGVAVGPIFADQGQIEQIIVNLVVNARDAVRPGGKITIELADVLLDDAYATEHHGVVPGKHVMLAVSDDGHGMDEATRAKIFEPFFTTKEKGKGTGIGLATVYGIVTQSQGHIWVYSEPNVGTTFKVYLPHTELPPEEPPPSSRPRASLRRGSETLLLVEDTDPVRAISTAILTHAGYTVLAAAGGDDAVAIADKHEGRIDLLITDVVLPGTKGRELAQELVAKRPDLRVLYMSGYAPDAVVQHGLLDAGAPFLPKPITPDSLLAKTREVLDRPRLATRREHILHVDDEETLLALISRVLGRLGYRVSGFSDPLEAVEAFRNAPNDFHAVVTDIDMPGLNGFQLVRALREIRPDIPIVVTSGAFRAEDIDAAKSLDLHSLVVKPNTVEELGRAVHEELSRHERRA